MKSRAPIPHQPENQRRTEKRAPTRTRATIAGSESAAMAARPEIAFIADTRSNAPFADLKGAGSVDDPAGMLNGWTQVEAMVGIWNTVPAALIAHLADKRRAVARIAVPPGDFANFVGEPADSGWHGTGFLVGKNLLLTNHHVLNSVEVAKSAKAEFNYELSVEDLAEERTGVVPAVKQYRLDPDRLFITSPADEGLDYTFVWIEEDAAKEFGSIPMKRASFTVNKFDPVFIIHHPRGRLKEISVDDTEVVRMRSTVIHYAADTDFGSSGSPVFDRSGRLIALHHARNGDGQEILQDGGTATVLNEGIKIAAIAIDLENRIKSGAQEGGMARTVLGAMSGSDTLAGFFGSLGRKVESGTAVEAVVGAYTGTEQDVDIGFWNIEWLANRWRNPDKLAGAASVIADLNLDIWCLEEVSPQSVEALVATMLERFGETYAYALSEPDAAEGKQTTAVIWKPRNVTGRKVEWPAPIADWWHLDSRDDLPFESVDGKIFNRYPGLFEFSVNGRGAPSAFDFKLVPLHLKAMAEGSKRRRLASLLLARAIKRMVDDGADADWIIGGDVNDSLASGDFNALTEAGMIAMAAADEAEGGFTYLKSPRSLIDNIFLTENITRSTGGTNYFIVAKEKSVDKFVKTISDHRPVVLRVSLCDAVAGKARLDEDELNAIADRITAGGGRPRRKAANGRTRHRA